MIQIIIEPNERYSVAESAQMAIEKGCGWLILRADAIAEDERRSTALEVVELAREAEIILTVINDTELARETGMHGVFLTQGHGIPAEVRQELGPEAIIGAEIGSPDAALTLEKADIDYVALPSSLPLEKASEIISAVRNGGGEIAFVSYGPQAGGCTPERISELQSAGFAGLCVPFE